MKTMAQLKADLARIPKPAEFPDGQCKGCYAVAGNCKYHIAAGAIRDREQSDMLRGIGEHFRLEREARKAYHDGCDLNHNEDHLLQRHG